MRAALLIVTAITLNLPGCKEEPLSCSSREARDLLKASISMPRGSQKIEDYTPEIDISLSDLRPSGLPPDDSGWSSCLGYVDVAANKTRGLPMRGFDVGYRIRGKKDEMSLQILIPDEY